jgi:nicotinic acid mononucleotide adenylyltransferase
MVKYLRWDNGLISLWQSYLGGIAVVYRYGENQSLNKSIINENTFKLYFIALNDKNDISSTLIREKLQMNEDCEHLIYKSVLEYLQMKNN